MDEEDRELLREHSRLIKELQEDFQKFYKVIKHILPEIEHTKTLTRLEKEMSDSRKKIKIDIV
jgi:tryptophanyl-tRNA synthetase